MRLVSGFVLLPIAFQSLALLAVAITFHAATGHRYPHTAHSGTKTARTPVTSPASGFRRADLEAVLGRRNELLDIAPDDLESLLVEVQLQSYVRTFTGTNCADIMSRPVVSVSQKTTVATAAAVLRRHNVKALPVIDDKVRVVGIITRADLARSMTMRSNWSPVALLERWRAGTNGATLTVASITSMEVFTVTTATPIAQLVPIFAAYGHHHIPVLDAHERLAGMITQADLILSLYRQSHTGAEPTL